MELTPKEAQSLRLMLVMYRQEWRDAIIVLKVAAVPVEHDTKRMYKMLCEIKEEL